VHRRAPLKPDKEESPLPLRATGIFLGVWMAALFILAFFVVPQLFAICAPAVPPPSPSP
jgi:hypothetical protein